MSPFDALSPELRQHLVEYVRRIADDRLILGHRLSEWCGHGPFLEEDIALANIALDLIGQASSWLALAGVIEGQGRDADSLAYFRDAVQFKNAQLVERPRGDFAETIARQFLFDSYSVLLLQALHKSTVAEVHALAAKCLKEDTYHLRHSRQWVLRLGCGTEESHARIQHAFNEYWRFTGELFESDEISRTLAQRGIALDPATLRDDWIREIKSCFSEATIALPENETAMTSGSRSGLHSEFLGHLLTEMQILPRSYPDARW